MALSVPKSAGMTPTKLIRELEFALEDQAKPNVRRVKELAVAAGRNRLNFTTYLSIARRKHRGKRKYELKKEEQKRRRK